MLVRKAHWAIDKVTGDMSSGRFAFNTAIAAVMELTNEISRLRDEAARARCASRWRLANSLLFSFAPHAAADGYHLLTGRRVWEEPWPQADPDFLASDTYELVCQVNGKLRDRVEVAGRRGSRCARGRRAAGAERAHACRRTRGREGHRRCPASS